jgi:hypothetical protein
MPSFSYRLDDFVERLRHLPETPLASLRRSIWWFRKTFFTKPRPGNAGFVVPLTEDEAERLLGRHYFDPGWEFSYSYRHEILNLRRVEFFDHPDYPEYEWWQVHVRGYDHPDGIELTAHFETEPTENPDAHVDMVGLELERGMDALENVLDEEGIEYRLRED